jgi:hypothetical protein
MPAKSNLRLVQPTTTGMTTRTDAKCESAEKSSQFRTARGQRVGAGRNRSKGSQYLRATMRVRLVSGPRPYLGKERAKPWQNQKWRQ